MNARYPGVFPSEATTPGYRLRPLRVRLLAGIGNSAFSDCSDLTSVTVGSVTSIGDDAFSGCPGLANLILPEGLSSIGMYSFSGCLSLTSITLPDSISSIGDGAFEGCEALAGATFLGNVPSTFGASVFYDTAPSFTISYYSWNSGWSTPQWTSPSGDIYNAQPIFQVNPFSCTVVSGVPQLIRVSDLLARVSGNAPTVVGVGTDGHNLLSANGTTLFLNSSFVLYTNTAIRKATSDSFQYTVQDASGNTAMSTVSITITPVTTASTVGQSIALVPGPGQVTVNFFGVPGYRYTPERSTDLVTWVALTTEPIIAPANSLMQVVDDFSDLGSPPSQAYYRLSYTP